MSKKNGMKAVVICLLAAMIAGLFTGCLHEHNWMDATCYSPMTCLGCGETIGEPRGHIWNEAACDVGRQCDDCGKTEGEALGHDFVGGDAFTPAMCSRCDAMQPLALPESGQVFLGRDMNYVSQLSVTAAALQSSYVKLKGTSGEDVFSFFVRAGETVTVDVPGGYFYVYFAYGTDWYGTEYLFGPNTTYSKDDELTDFENYTWEYTLTPVTDGNFSETPIDADEF